MQGSANCSNPPAVNSICPSVPSSIWDAIKTVYLFNRDCVSDYSSANGAIVNFARFFPIFSMLKTTSASRGNVRTSANPPKTSCNFFGMISSTDSSRAVNSLVRTGTNYASQAVQAVSNLGNTLHDASVATVNFLQNSWNTGVNAVASWLGSLGR